MNNSKKIGFILGLIMFILLLVGGTFAFWIWRGTFARVAVTANVPFNCAADGGVHDSTNKLMPAACTHERYAIKREITVDYSLFSPDSSVYMDMILTVNNIDQGLRESANFKYALTTEDDSCTKNVIASGTFTNKANGTKIKLLDNAAYIKIGMNIINTYYLYIWIDAKEENRDVLNKNFEFSLSLECTQGQYWNGATMLVSKANDASITSYEEGNTGEMYTFSQPETAQVSATTDYRYIGDSPNNYIRFNDELWRIIGVFDGRIKIVKKESIGNMAWDYKLTGIGSAPGDYGSNDWVDSQLMYMLNPTDIATNVAKKTGYTHDDTYVYDASGNIIYQKGCKPASTDGTSYSCTTNTWSLNSTALSQIADVTYYLGGSNIYDDLSAPDYYTFERGDTTYNDVRSTNWNGKVGLMYPSDYAYTFANGVDNTCYSDGRDCSTGIPSSSWLYDSSISQWTQSPRSSQDNNVFYVYTSGDLNSGGGAYYDHIGVRPVVYLKADVYLNGTGTDSNPYEIVDADNYIPPFIQPGVNATDGALMLINKANSSSVTTYNNGDKGEMYTFSQPKTVQVSATTDYRYIGNSPNNYITFNNETWRIIGVFNGRIKIIKDTRIGTSNLNWDYKLTGIGSSTSDYGSNDWVDSQLMYMLNPNDIATNVAKKTGYTFDGSLVKDANEKTIYQKGCNPASTDGTSYTCTTNDWSLNSTALSQIADVTYYLGGKGRDSTTNYGTTPEIYTWERGVAKCDEARSTSWIGKVGLMYTSDYAYTFAYGVDDTCYDDAYNCQTDNNAVPSSSWLYTSSYNQWAFSPNSNSTTGSYVFYVTSTGLVRSTGAYSAYGVRPVVYLKSDVKLTGTGTVDDKYEIVMPQQSGAAMLIEKANDASITTYSSGVTTEMYTFSQPATTQLGATTDYRYIGSSPNNYITFNNETWRIIGVFDGRIKIIKDTRIGTSNILWDEKKTGIGSSTSDSGSNDWVDAQLMYFLNPNDIATNVALKSGYTFDGTYVKDANGKIIYQKGCNPASADGTSYSCTTNSWSLNSTALSQVADVTYYLGGTSSYTNLSTSGFYGIERGETKYNDVRSTNWTGKVGLMYPSDYGYTFAYGVDDTCYSNPYNCNASTPSSSWLYTSSYLQWTLSPCSSLDYLVFFVDSSGNVYNFDAYYTFGVRPVVYLKSDITLTGTGTSGDPYVIG